MTINLKENYIKNYINESGMLLLNVNKYFPSLMGIGGDWDTIMSLIEKREAFYSKLYKKRTTYISKKLYFYIKEFKHKNIINGVRREIYEFLNECGKADTEIIKKCLLLSDKSFNEAMDWLTQNLYVTVLERGKTLNPQWTTFVWGTYEKWESDCDFESSVNKERYTKEIVAILSKNISLKNIEKILK